MLEYVVIQFAPEQIYLNVRVNLVYLKQWIQLHIIDLQEAVFTATCFGKINSDFTS